MTVAFLARSALIPREARFFGKDFALRARVGCANENATVIDRRYTLKA